ncbi:MAG: hypothetical protein FJZ16_08075 [Candidatus Omnitrophica bacterium]|nr:hypothetical protein [Candidatus Omnitrophota bacterium]
MHSLSAILKVKFNILNNKLHSIRKHSTFKILFVGFSSFIFLAGLFLFAYKLFAMLQAIQGVGIVLISRILFLFFFSLFCMLIFSNIIVAYSTMYGSEEVEFLFSMPLNYKGIFISRFIETLVLSSWTFVFLLVPFMSAYGIIKALPWYFYISLIFFFIPFLFISAVIGITLTIFLIRFIPRKYFKALFVNLFILVIIFVLLSFKLPRVIRPHNLEDIFMLGKFAPYFKLSQSPLLPSWWIAQGILSFNFVGLKEAMFFWLLLLSTAIVFVRFSIFLANRYYYSGWVLFYKGAQKEKFDFVSFFINKLEFLWEFLKPEIKSLITKDIKIFWRDPIQWSQFTVFFGLLAVYFANIHNLSYDILPAMWRNLVAFLNLGSTTLTLGSLCVRFVFPLFSLEGKRFWILGLAPLKLSVIILEKFWLWVIISLLITMPLIILSNTMLGVSGLIMGVSCYAVFLMCFSLVSISIGLGAIFPNFKEDNPASIVSGFGGTLAFVLTLFYVAFVVVLIAVPFHLHFVLKMISHTIFIKQLLLVGLIIFITSLLTSIIPMVLAVRRLREMEF